MTSIIDYLNKNSKQIKFFRCNDRFSYIQTTTFPSDWWLSLHVFFKKKEREYRDLLPLSVADERWQTSWGGEKQTKSIVRNITQYHNS